MTAVTVENTGGAGAEIPVTVRSGSGEETQSLLIPAHQKATIRLSLAGQPTKVTINDGAVPEGDASDDAMDVK